MKRLLLLLAILILTGCAKKPLIVYTDFFDERELASYQVGTPDPKLNCPDVGQRMIMAWCLPYEYRGCDDLRLDYIVRLRNHEQFQDSFYLNCKSGYTYYMIKNEDFFNSGGIATFKVEISNSEGVIYEWIHPLWVDLIQVGQ